MQSKDVKNFVGSTKDMGLAILYENQTSFRVVCYYTIKLAKVWHCLKKLYQLDVQNKFILYWVPKYWGILSSKQADKLEMTFHAFNEARTLLCNGSGKESSTK